HNKLRAALFVNSNPRGGCALPPEKHLSEIRVEADGPIAVVLGLESFVRPVDHSDIAFCKINVLPSNIQDITLSLANQNTEPHNRRDSCIPLRLKNFFLLIIF